jgi:hypothetical protein
MSTIPPKGPEEAHDDRAPGEPDDASHAPGRATILPTGDEEHAAATGAPAERDPGATRREGARWSAASHAGEDALSHFLKGREEFRSPPACCASPNIFETQVTIHGEPIEPVKICRTCGAWRLSFHTGWTPAEPAVGYAYPEGGGFLIPGVDPGIGDAAGERAARDCMRPGPFPTQERGPEHTERGGASPTEGLGDEGDLATDVPPPSDELPTDAPPPSAAAEDDELSELRQDLREDDLGTASLAELLFYAVADQCADGSAAILRAARDELFALSRLALATTAGAADILPHADLGAAMDQVVRRLDVVIELNARMAMAARGERAEAP